MNYPDPYRIALMLLKHGQHYLADNLIQFDGWKLHERMNMDYWLQKKHSDSVNTPFESQLGRAIRAAWK